MGSSLTTDNIYWMNYMLGLDNIHDLVYAFSVYLEFYLFFRKHIKFTPWLPLNGKTEMERIETKRKREEILDFIFELSPHLMSFFATLFTI